MYVTMLALPVLLARREGFGGATAGLLLVALSVASLAVTPAGGRLVDRAGARAPAVAGLALLAAALVPLPLAPAAIPRAALAGCLVAAGAGLGLASAALQVAAVAGVGAADAGVADAGVAAGLFSTARYAGSIAGTALPAGPLAPAPEGTAGFGALFAVLVLAAAGSCAAALRLPGARGEALAAPPVGAVSAAPGRA